MRHGWRKTNPEEPELMVFDEVTVQELQIAVFLDYFHYSCIIIAVFLVIPLNTYVKIDNACLCSQFSR